MDTSAVESITNSTTAEGLFYQDSRIFYAYMISGGMDIVAACILLMNLYCDSTQVSEIRDTDNAKYSTSNNARFRILFLIGLFFFYIAYNGFGANYGNYVSTYAVKELAFTKQQGAQVSNYC